MDHVRAQSLADENTKKENYEKTKYKTITAKVNFGKKYFNQKRKTIPLND